MDDFENTGELDSWLKDRQGRTGECKQFNDFTDWSNPTTESTFALPNYLLCDKEHQ